MTHRRLFIGVACAALTTSALVLPASSASATQNFGDTCVADDTTTPNTWILQGDCETSATIVIPDGWTLDGKQHTITALESGTPFSGPIISSDTSVSGAKLSITRLKINTAFGGVSGVDPVVGIKFDGAYGAVSNTSITGVSHGTTADDGYGIEVDNSAAVDLSGKQVRISATTVSRYQKAGIYVHGPVKVSLINSTVRTSTDPGGSPILGLAADAVSLASGATGAIKGSTISVNGFAGTPRPTGEYSTGVRLYNTGGRIGVTNSVIASSTDGDIGLSVDNDPSSLVRTTADVSCTLFSRAQPSSPDPYGYGVLRFADNGKKTSSPISDSTFAGWKQDTTIYNGTSFGAGDTNNAAGQCPPSAPKSVLARGGDHSSKVTWKAGNPLAYAPVTGYTVLAKAAGRKPIKTTVGGDATSATVAGLNNTLSYTVTVQANSNGGSTSATDMLYPTSMKFGAKPGKIRKGQKSVLRGTLSSKDPSAKLARRVIFISVKKAGGAWKVLKTARTTPMGTFSVGVRPGKRTTYRASYAGAPDLASSRLTTVRVRR